MFPSEKDLVEAFKQVAADFLEYDLASPAPAFFLVEEFDSLSGIADIVIGTYHSIDRQEKSRKTISWNWVRPIFNLTEDQKIDLNSFTQQYSVSKTTARVRLKEYADAGFLKELSPGRYKVIREYKLITDTIISIEAKLKNWKQALNQAIRYQRFSNKTYVLLDKKHVNPALRNLAMFQNWNVGLLSMDDKEYETHYRPIVQEVPKTHSFFRLNEAAFGYFRDQEVVA